jgi:hypothetical protein
MTKRTRRRGVRLRSRSTIMLRRRVRALAARFVREGRANSPRTRGATARRCGAKVVLGAASCEAAAPPGAPSGVSAMGGRAFVDCHPRCAPVCAAHPTGMKARATAGRRAVRAVSELLAEGRSAPGGAPPSPGTKCLRGTAADAGPAPPTDASR